MGPNVMSLFIVGEHREPATSALTVSVKGMSEREKKSAMAF